VRRCRCYLNDSYECVALSETGSDGDADGNKVIKDDEPDIVKPDVIFEPKRTGRHNLDKTIPTRAASKRRWTLRSTNGDN